MYVFRGVWISVLVDILHSQKPEGCCDGSLRVQFLGRKHVLLEEPAFLLIVLYFFQF